MFDVSIPEDPAWLDGLNDRQCEAVLHGDGPLLVIAGAGSGKTRTLASRVARLVDEGIPAERVLLLTFTRRAASEMLRRSGALISNRSVGRVWGGTFHAVANRLLRQYGAAVGLADGFTVIDQSDAASLFGMIRTELGFGGSKQRFPKKETIAAVYSRTVNARTPLSETVEERFPWVADHVDALREIFRAYTARKKDHNVVDYDDLLLYWNALLDSPTGGTVRNLFDHVLVDEYQDTNRSQAEILRSLCGASGNLTVVGDDAQAIYSFRGATVENILGFPEAYENATVVTLEQNYRSTPQILDAANAVIDASSETFQKELWTERPAGRIPDLITCFDEAAQADLVADRVLEHREAGTPLRDQAVLFRTGHHSAGLEIELSRRNIPFVKYGGLRFLEAAHVKDLLALLRILDNPKDELAWNRVLQMIPGIGPATSLKITDHLDGEAAKDDTDRLVALTVAQFPVVAEAREPMRELQSALRDCRGSEGVEPGPSQQIERLIPFCTLVFDRAYEDSTARLTDLGQLAALASEYGTRSRFLTEITLDPPASTSDLAGPPHLDDDYLTLSTIHSAKGGEWRAVFVIHAADGNIPSDMAISDPGGLDEERRLLYVALTRAKDHLHVTVPQRFYHKRFSSSREHSYALPSRFLDPAMEQFEKITVGVSQHGDGAETLVAGKDPVADVLEDLWR
ncbi:MAG: ATP-dependent helicase [Actinomycetota bacterium]|nr:ATP-dependent helicase [Actinomycetota bacterium]